MKIAVIGAGVIGVTSALELASHGHDVIVFEKSSGIAQQASFATSGFIGPGMIHSWTAPGLPLKMLKQILLGADTHAVQGLTNIPLAWFWQWYKASKHPSYKLKLEALQRLAFYSQEVLMGITEQHGLQYEKSQGSLLVCKHERDLKNHQLQLDLLSDSGIPFRKLDQEQTLRVEPSLSSEQSFYCAVMFPNDTVANCRQFSLLAKQQASLLGANFKTGQEVLPLITESPRLIRTTSGFSEKFDHVVICAGIHSKFLVKNLGIQIPSLAVNGYTLSSPVRQLMDAPVYGVIDARHHVSIARTGQRIRVSGIAEIGHNKKRSEDCVKLLYEVLNDWFPGAAKTHEAVQVWRGTRDLLTDGVPILGHSGIKGVWLNTGHGNHGWATSCGSARAIADMVSGRECEVDLKGLGIERF
ncbi:MAG: FAD-dependent oxidoreductase [Limnohabitans sp.]